MKYGTKKEKNIQSLKWAFIKHLLSIIMLFAVVICLVRCGGSHVHQTQARELANLIDVLLISEKLCKDKNDCILKEYVLIRPSKIIEIYVYGVNDQSIAKKIIGLCIDTHSKNPGIQYNLTMYAQTKNETIKGKSKTTMLQLILNKEE